MDTACASSFTAFFQAYYSLRAGLCDQAIVCGAAVNLRPTIALGFNNLRMTSNDGRSKCMDASADGYGRSEACVSILLQRSSEAKRIYATVIKTKTNTDGYKAEGITYPSIDSQYRLMSETQREAGINPHDMTYIEAHMTGTPAGDVVESESIRRTFCEGRSVADPLLIGCLKSNLGHTEGASGTCALTKVCLAFENRELPPNLHLKTLNPNIEGLRSGILKPVTERREFTDNVVGVSSFGFGGCNVYTILKANEKEAQPSSFEFASQRLPRIINVCGRTREAVDHIFQYVQDNRSQVTNEFLDLLSHSMKTNPALGMNYRGYMIVDESQTIEHKIGKVEEKRPLWLVFSGLPTSWKTLSSAFLEFEPFTSSLNRSIALAASFNVDLNSTIFTRKDDINLMDGMIAITAIQIAFYDLLEYLDIKVDGVLGHSIGGEIVAAYADKCLTAEQTLRVSHCISMHLLSVSPQNGKTGLDCTEIGLHTDKVAVLKQSLAKSLAKVIGSTSPARTSKWLSSSLPEDRWHLCEPLTAEYFVNSIISPINFKQAFNHMPKNAAIMEISPQALLEGTLKRGLGPDISYLSLPSRRSSSIMALLGPLGSLYATGQNVAIEKLYPKVEYPVARGTLSISPLLKWDHSKSCTITKLPEYFNVVKAQQTREIDLMQPSQQYLAGHVIDGRNLVPAVEYLRAAWAQMAGVKGSLDYTSFPVEFRKVRLFRAIMMSRHKPSQMVVKYVKESGEFEVLEGGSVCCSGYVCIPDDPSTAELEAVVKPHTEPDALSLNAKDIYKEFRVRGYDYQPTFQGLVEASSDSSSGKVKWLGQWVSFTDSMLQLAILGQNDRALRIPTYIEYIKCDVKTLMDNIEKKKDELGESIIDVVYDKNIGVGASKGIVIMGLKTSEIARRQGSQKATIESYEFVPFESEVSLSSSSAQKMTDYIGCCNEMLEKISVCSQAEEKANEIEEKMKKMLASGSKSYALLNSLYQSYYSITSKAAETGQAEENNNIDCTKSQDVQDQEEVNLKDHVLTELRKRLALGGDNLSSDMLISLPLINEHLTRHQIDIFIENSSSRKVKIVEVNCTSNFIFDPVTELFDAHHFQADYSILHSSTPTPIVAPGATLVDWTKHLQTNCDLPTNLKEIDLLIYKDESTRLNTCPRPKALVHNLSQFLESVQRALKPNAFALLFFRTRPTAIEDKINDLLADNDDKTSAQDKAMYTSMSQVGTLVKELGFHLISQKEDKACSFCSLLIRKPLEQSEEQPVVIRVKNATYDWVDEMKSYLVDDKKKDDDEGSDKTKTKAKKPKVWLLAEDTPNGLIGLVNCLRREPGCDNVRCCIDLSSDSNTFANLSRELLDKDMVMNVFKDGVSGTFRHTLLEEELEERADTEHAYVDIRTKGDMSSFRWLENSTKYWKSMPSSQRGEDETLCTVYYAPLNFKDVMIASGRISTDAYPSKMGLNGGLLGMEFSGRDVNGNRVMGYSVGKAIATQVQVVDPLFLWPVPDHWSLAEAATVPIVYATVYYGLIIRGQIQRGESILIHSGAGGVGQAAIQVCQQLGCNVFTTCGSQEKRDFLMSNFGLKANQIAHSRDLSFEEHIMRETNGKGVDLVLNSLSESMLKASVRCLADYGRFVEIGKYDIIVNNALGKCVGVKHRIYLACTYMHQHLLQKITLYQTTYFLNTFI